MRGGITDQELRAIVGNGAVTAAVVVERSERARGWFADLCILQQF